LKYFHKVSDEQIKQELLDCDGLLILGKLTIRDAYGSSETVHNVPGTQSIAMNIAPLSEEPRTLIDLRKILYSDNIYIALDKDQMSFIINDLTYFSKPQAEKITHWQEALNDRFIIFKTLININDDKVTLKVQIQSIEFATEVALSNKYTSIPLVEHSQEVVEYALYNEQPIEFSNIPNFNKAPKYFICDDALYYNFPHWERSTDHEMGWFISGAQINIYRIKLAAVLDQIEEDLIESFGGVAFLNMGDEQALKAKFVEFGEIVPARKVNPNVILASQLTANTNTIPFEQAAIKAEYLFLSQLRGLTLSENLLYDPKDLMNFHISLKTNPLTVVAGMSGTGKTRLANAYATMLGLAEEKGDLLFLPISPSYLEPSDVLGYFNPSSGYFVPSEAGLVDLLIRASRNPHEMHMVIFDEMNLSQVEHWFAPFLSILEKPEHDRLLRLYSENTTCNNADLYPASVNVGANVLFIGTINLDETTKDLSDRLLDRVNLVSLTKSGFMQFSTLDPEKEKYNRVVFDYHDFQSWINTDVPTKAFKAKDLHFFDELHQLISKYDTQKGVSFRFLNRLGRYIQNIPRSEKGKLELEPTKAMDISIKQALLTKIKGSKQQIGNLIGEITDPKAELVNSELLDFLNNNKSIKAENFDHTKEEIKRKALELGLYGYTN